MNNKPYNLFDIITRPLQNEKSMRAGEYGQVFFQVRRDATKPEIKAAVEHIFNVKVTAVNTLIVKGKTRRFRGRLGQRSDWKKAMVTLAADSHIDLEGGA